MEPAPPAALHAAIALRDRGWRPFPLDHPSLPQCASAHKATGGVCPEPDKRGKHPAGHWPTMAATVPTDGMLELWFGRAPRNLGISCRYSGLLVLDEDTDGALEALAESLGETPPSTYRVRTSRGWHWYLADPDGEFGNSPGLLADWHIDVRGSKGRGDHGGYVVAAGSQHISGAEYLAEDPWADVLPIPEWIKAQLRATRAPVSKLRRAGDPRPAGTDAGGWNDDPRPGYAAELAGQYRRHLDGVRTRGGNFRHELYLAALDGWRLVNAGAMDEFTMLSEIKEAVVRVWGADPDDNDRNIVYTEAAAKAKASPWVVIDAPGGDTDPVTPGDDERHTPDAEELYARELSHEVKRERLRREARAVLAAEDSPEPVRLTGAAFLDAPMPEPLVPGMLYRDSLAQVFGPPGSTKSFLTLDVALRLANGMDWNGHRLPAGPVHYVMAEGQAVNVARTRAWLRQHELGPEALDQFSAFPVPILLTEHGIARYLEDVERDRPVLVVLDTKNAMMDGEENSGSDVAVMVRAMHAIRRVSGACVVLVDHTGKRDVETSRGSNAVMAAVDTQLRVLRDPDSGLIEVTCTRDKAAEAGTQWHYRLQVVAPAAVLVPARPDAGDSPLGAADLWHRDPAEIPEAVLVALGTAVEARKAQHGKDAGKGKSTALDVYRLLRYVGGERGLTIDDIKAGLAEGPRVHHRSQVSAAIGLLDSAGVTVPGSTAARMLLAPQFDTP